MSRKISFCEVAKRLLDASIHGARALAADQGATALAAYERLLFVVRNCTELLSRRAAHHAWEINRGLLPIVQQTGQPIFATAFFAVIDLVSGTLSYGNAGHPPPLVLRAATGTVEALALADPEPAAGLVENFAYSHHQCEFLPGDKLLGYTDGLFEAVNSAGAMFGEEKLRSLIQRSAGLTCEKLIERLVAEVVAFTGRSDFDDDVCVLAVESVKNPA